MLPHAERNYEVRSAAPPTVAWSLVACPGRWRMWAPHIRGAWGLGGPEVREGSRGAARLLGVVPVPARIVSVVPGRSWTWQVGPIRLTHAVEPLDGPRAGSRLVFSLSGPVPVVHVYGPVVHLLMLNLARVAEQEASGADAGSG